MAGAMGIIQPLRPQILAGQNVKLAAARALGEDGAGKRDMALEDQGEVVAHLLRRRADRYRAGDVGGAVAILPARIDQIEAAALDRAIGLFLDPIMDDGAVRSRAADRVEGQVFQQPAILAEGFQPVGGGQFGQAALGRLDRDPVEEAAERRAVTRLRRLVPGDLDVILDRLGQDGGIAQRQHLRPALFQRFEDRGDGAFGIGDDGLAAKPRQRIGEDGAVMDTHGIAQMLGDGFLHLLRRDEQVSGRVGMDDRIGERDRRAIDILAPYIEGPGDRIQRRQDRRVGLFRGQPVGHFPPLFRRIASGEAIVMHHQPGGAGRGAIGPDGVDRVGVHRHQFRALLGQRLGRLLHPGAGVEPGVVTDARALPRMILQPCGDRGLRHAFILPVVSVHLLAHLECVAAIDEDRRFLRQHHRAARRSLKSGQPGETLGIGADIFAHMLVGQRHHEAVQLLTHQLCAESLQAVFITGHQTSLEFIRPLHRA